MTDLLNLDETNAAIEITKAICSNPNTHIVFDEKSSTTAEYIAEFILTLQSKLTSED